jgi:Ca2+-binding EF-hand superfamily protein
MLTKLKLALALSATLITGAVGIAAAQSGPDNNGPVRQAILQKYDTNGDGVLDANERAAMRADFQAKRAAHKAKMLAKYDTNHDGKLEPDERAAMRADRAAKQFAKMDTNGDGQVTLAEFQAFKAARGGRGGWRRHHGMKPGFSQGAPGQGPAEGPAQ